MLHGERMQINDMSQYTMGVHVADVCHMLMTAAAKPAQ
jgi:hypothetical protein